MNISYNQDVFTSNSIIAIKCISYNPSWVFLQTERIYFPTLSYTPYPFKKPKAWKEYPFWAGPPSIDHYGIPQVCSLTEIIFLASNDNFFTNLGGTSVRLFLAGVCSSVLRSLEFMTVACSLTWSYCFFIKPFDTNLSTIASASLWSLN